MSKRKSSSSSSDESFHPQTSSTLIKGGKDETTTDDGESNVTVTKSTGCQTLSFSNTGTQTSPVTDENESQVLLISMATLANRLLHASYWFVAASALASKMGFERLRRTIDLRQTTASLSATRIFQDLIVHDSLVTADVAKPKFNFQDCSTAHLAKLVHDLDKWLVTSCQAVHVTSMDEGTPDQVKILETIFAEQTRFAKESESMNSETFLQM